jgi:UDP-N-acetylglucosamine 2-epimerase
MNKNLIFVLRKISIKEIELFKNNKSSIILGLHPSSRICLEKLNITYLTLKDYLDKKDYVEYLDELNTSIDGLWNSLNEKHPLRDFLTYKNLLFWERSRAHLAFELFDNFVFYKIIKKIIDYEKPQNIIILANRDNDTEYIIKSIAKSYGVTNSVFYPTPLLEIKNIYRFLFNFFFIRPHPFIDLLRKWPQIFIYIEKLQEIKEKLLSLIYKNYLGAQYNKKFGSIEKKKILILSFSGYYNFIKVVANIIDEINKDKKNLFIFVRAHFLSRDFKRRCHRLGIAYKSFYDYLSPDINFKLKGILKDTQNMLLKSKKTIILNDIFDYIANRMGFIPRKVLYSLLEDHFSFYRLRILIRFKLIMESIIEKEKPDIIIIQEDRTEFGRIVTEEAKRKNTPSLVILQHISDYDPFWNFFLRLPYNANHFAVTTTTVKDLLIQLGTPSEKITVVGNPVYDKLFKTNLNLMKKEDVYSKLKIDKEKGIFLFTSQPLQDSDLVHRILIEMMQNFPNKHLVIKLHPQESSLRNIFAARKAKFKNVTVIHYFDAWSLINVCELLITISSTTAFEAMALRRPVVIIGFAYERDIADYLTTYVSPYVESGAALGVYNHRDLVSTIKKVLNDKNVRIGLFKNMEKFVSDLKPNDGLASRRISDLINGMLKNEKKQF